MNVLLLDVGYQPLRAITARRAVRLMSAEKVEVVEMSDATMKSASAAMPLPSVIRLRYSISIPFRARVPLNRRAVLTRDRHKCAYCGHRASTIDHVIPRSRGGKHRWENVVAACSRCNSTKDNKTPEEAGMPLTWQPWVPSGIAWVIQGNINPLWDPYLGNG